MNLSSRILLYPTLGVVPTAFDRRWSEGSLEIRNGCGRSIDGWEIVRLDYGSGVLSFSLPCSLFSGFSFFFLQGDACALFKVMYVVVGEPSLLE